MTNKEAGTEILVLLSSEQSLELVSALKEESRNVIIISLFKQGSLKVKKKSRKKWLNFKGFQQNIYLVTHFFETTFR